MQHSDSLMEAWRRRRTNTGHMTPNEFAGKTGEQAQFLYLSTSESEESLSSDLEAEEEQGEVGMGRKEERVNHTKKRQKGYQQGG